MDIEQKQSLLTQLAQTEGDAALHALLKEAEKIAAILAEETTYNGIEEQISLLGFFAWRVPEKAFEITCNLLSRLEKIDLKYEAIGGFSIDEIKRLNHKNSLIIKALGILGAICFHERQMDLEIFRTFLKYSVHSERLVRQEATSKLSAIASYRIEVWNVKFIDGGILGAAPQLSILEFLNKLDTDDRKKYLIGITTLCDALLSPTIDGSTFTYNKAIFQQGAIPADDSIKKIRQGVILLLDSLYLLAETARRKKSLINTLQAATRAPHQAKYGDDVMEMIFSNIEVVLAIYNRIASQEPDLEIVQHIEHIAYWHNKHGYSEAIKSAALKIRDTLAKNAEYEIFKTLIGFEGVFTEWRTLADSREAEDAAITNEIEEAKKIRTQRVHKLVEQISTENFKNWEARIVQYAQIQSNDMATFPSFINFLELLSKKVPDFTLSLLEIHAEALYGFIPFILWGAYETSEKKRAENLIYEWINKGVYLRQIIGMFDGIKNWDFVLFKAVSNKAIKSADAPALRQIIGAIADNYDSSRKDLLNTIGTDAIKTLTTLEDPSGVLNIWFRKEIRSMVNDMNTDTINAVIGNLIYAKDINYEAEAVLSAISELTPDVVIEFFSQRIKRENQLESRLISYNAIPYEFHSLQKTLSAFPDKILDITSQWYDGNYGMFIYRGGKFLKNIFPDFPLEFQNKLIAFIKECESNRYLFVLAILRNYDGNPLTHQVCKELVKVLPPDSAEWNEVSSVLQSTGVVMGEYGFTEAYQRKKEEISRWLSDDNEKVRIFSQQQIIKLDHLIDWSKKRADEDIELRKFKYDTEE